MTQPAIRKPPSPTLYLLGFDCYPNDREYFEARRATRNATPYWFKEKLVYEDIAVRPLTRTVVIEAPKSSMGGTREYIKDSETVKVEVRETTRDDEAREEIKLLETQKTKEKEQPAKRPPKSPHKKIITIPLPKRRVVFAWTPRDYQRPHTSTSHRAHTPLHRQRTRNPKHAVDQWQGTGSRPFFVTTPPPHLPPSHCRRLPTYTVPLAQPSDRAEHQGNGSGTV